MEYFISHIPHILIMGLIMAGLCLIMIFCAEKNEKERDINQERCNNKCGSCSNYDICHKPEKKIV